MSKQWYLTRYRREGSDTWTRGNEVLHSAHYQAACASLKDAALGDPEVWLNHSIELEAALSTPKETDLQWVRFLVQAKPTITIHDLQP